jgi:hypothetical protein
MYQLRIELLNSLRSSSFIQKLLLSDAASIRQSRLECLHAFTHTQFDIINAVVRLSFENRSNRLKSAFRWNLVDSQMFQKEPKVKKEFLSNIYFFVVLFFDRQLHHHCMKNLRH